MFNELRYTSLLVDSSMGWLLHCKVCTALNMCWAAIRSLSSGMKSLKMAADSKTNDEHLDCKQPSARYNYTHNEPAGCGCMLISIKVGEESVKVKSRWL